MSSDRLRDPPVRRGLVAAGIVALWGALFAALGAPLVGLVLAGVALLASFVVLLAKRRPRLPALRLPRFQVGLWRLRLAFFGRRLRAPLPPAARWFRARGATAARAVPPLAARARAASATFAERAGPAVASAAEASKRAGAAAAAPVERRRRRAAMTKEAWQLNAEGVEHRREGRGAAAVDAHERAVTLFRQLADDRSEGLALNNLGLALMAEGDDVGAIDAFERSLALLGRLGDRQAEGRVLANLGTLHRRLDRQEAALLYWRQALARLDADSPEHERMAELVELAS